MEQLAQRRLHLLLCTCSASRWPLTRMLSNLWSTHHWGGLIILNYLSKQQWKREKELICLCGTDLQLTRRRWKWGAQGEGEITTGRVGSTILESGAASLKELRRKGTQSRAGACSCVHTRVCSQCVTANASCCPWLSSSTVLNERGKTSSFVCQREYCYLIIFN